jgi:hypothetical protein
VERRHVLTQTAAGCLAAIGFLLIPGCSDDGLGTRYPVSGTVTYQDKPLEKGRITFNAAGPDARTASGEIEHGSYRLTTFTDGDGAMPGKYKVAITAKDADYGKLIEKSQGGIPHQRDVMKVNQQAKRLIPAKYELDKTSGLEREVKPESNTFDFALSD